MILYINTSDREEIKIGLKEGEKFVTEKVYEAKFRQAEKLLTGIEKMLTTAKKKLSDIEAIEVENHGGSFTSLRIGVITANALGFALGIPVTSAAGGDVATADFSIVEPRYDQEPTITIQKNK